MLIQKDSSDYRVIDHHFIDLAVFGSAFDGLVGTLLIGLFIVGYEGPHWGANVVKPYHDAKGQYALIIVSFILLALSYLAHQLGFFYIAKHSGCVVRVDESSFWL